MGHSSFEAAVGGALRTYFRFAQTSQTHYSLSVFELTYLWDIKSLIECPVQPLCTEFYSLYHFRVPSELKMKGLLCSLYGVRASASAPVPHSGDPLVDTPIDVWHRPFEAAFGRMKWHQGNAAPAILAVSRAYHCQDRSSRQSQRSSKEYNHTLWAGFTQQIGNYSDTVPLAEAWYSIFFKNNLQL